jgi:hypothetical protein
MAARSRPDEPSSPDTCGGAPVGTRPDARVSAARASEPGVAARSGPGARASHQARRCRGRCAGLGTGTAVAWRSARRRATRPHGRSRPRSPPGAQEPRESPLGKRSRKRSRRRGREQPPLLRRSPPCGCARPLADGKAGAALRRRGRYHDLSESALRQPPHQLHRLAQHGSPASRSSWPPGSPERAAGSARAIS